MKSFAEKYKPKSSKEIPQNLEVLKNLIKNKKNILLSGPSGSCKTFSVYTIANELDYEIIEVNASDFRNKDQIESIIGQASQQQSLFQREKILLIDEADCLSGTEDRGGAQAILNVLKTSKFPIIITANDPYNEKLKEIRKITNNIEFKPISNKETIKILKNICEKEQIIFSEDSLQKIAANCIGDIRAAINDLQSNVIKKELIYLEEKRDYELNIIYILNNVLKTKNFESYKILENANIDLDEYSLWLDENIPLEYKNQEDLLNAYNLISKADIMKGRIRRWQYWRLMYYQSLLLTSGISISKSKICNNFMPFKRPLRLLRIWQNNMKNSKKKSIAVKLSKFTHTSTKEVINNFRLYINFLKNNEIIKELELDEEEIKYITTV